MLHRKTDKVAYLYILPITLLSLVFIYYCIGFTLYSSFTDWNGMSPEMNFVGWANYVKLFHDKTFFTAVKNNLIFFAGTVFVQALVGFVLAVILKEKLPGTNLFKTIYFMPIAMATSVITGIFRILLNPTTGDINQFFRAIGWNALAKSWLGDPKLSLFSVICVNIFQWMGFSMIIYYAALMALPEDVYESAKLEGAGFWRTMVSLTFPMVRNTTDLLIILGIVGSLKTFDIVKLLTNGGPGRSSTVLNTYLYEKAFTNFAAGEAATIGICILIIAMLMSVAQIKLGESRR
ncbi:MAG: sugar ABC transporter permease [Sphaerochaeta sp.]|jgi:raffinose/stachyose/melibiose transport system permease protein|nr:sugar ABC transporter permease [Sphaerochaeta sp.]